MTQDSRRVDCMSNWLYHPIREHRNEQGMHLLELHNVAKLLDFCCVRCLL
jgi:hypothetical protein